MRGFIRYMKQDLANLKKNFLFLIAFSIFYGIEVLFLNQEAFTGYGQYRPLVFLPALIGIAFGSLPGAFVAGVGNFIYDVINKLFIQHKSLHLGHLIGFIGNFVGGYVVGTLSVDIDVRSKGLLSRDSLIDYLWNTFISIVGLGGVTGFIIGFGNYLIGRVETLNDALIFAGTIAVWNGIFMILLLLVLPIYGLLEKYQIEKRLKELSELTKITVRTVTPNPNIEVVGGRFIETVPIEREWTLVGVTIKNNYDSNMRYKVEIIGPDIIEPSTLFTREIEPNGVDEVTFSIYPLDRGERHMKVRVIPWGRDLNRGKEILKKGKRAEAELRYKAKPEESEKLSSLTSILGILVIFGLLVKAIYDLVNTKSISLEMSVALSLFIADIIMILLWYMYKKWTFRIE